MTRTICLFKIFVLIIFNIYQSPYVWLTFFTTQFCVRVCSALFLLFKFTISRISPICKVNMSVKVLISVFCFVVPYLIGGYQNAVCNYMECRISAGKIHVCLQCDVCSLSISVTIAFAFGTNEHVPVENTFRQVCFARSHSPPLDVEVNNCRCKPR
jgi:hypothetical protein